MNTSRVLSFVCLLLFLISSSFAQNSTTSTITVRHYRWFPRIINGCPERYFRYNHICANGGMMPMIWTEAKQMCEDLDTALIMVKTENEYEQLMNASDGTLLNLPGNILLGLRFTAVDKTWRWVDGTVFDPSKDWAVWYDGKPPPTPDEDMCMAAKENNDVLQFKVIQCSGNGFPICHKNATTVESVCPNGYLQVGPVCTNPILKWDNSWNNGQERCRKKDRRAHLIDVNYEFEMEEFFRNQVPRQMVVGIWIGLKYYASEGKWRYGDGREYAMGEDYARWKGGTPPRDNPDTDRCVILTQDDPNAMYEWTVEDCDAEIGIAPCQTVAADAETQIADLLNGTGDSQLANRLKYPYGPWFQFVELFNSSNDPHVVLQRYLRTNESRSNKSRSLSNGKVTTAIKPAAVVPSNSSIQERVEGQNSTAALVNGTGSQVPGKSNSPSPTMPVAQPAKPQNDTQSKPEPAKNSAVRWPDFFDSMENLVKGVNLVCLLLLLSSRI